MKTIERIFTGEHIASVRAYFKSKIEKGLLYTYQILVDQQIVVSQTSDLNQFEYYLYFISPYSQIVTVELLYRRRKMQVHRFFLSGVVPQKQLIEQFFSNEQEKTKKEKKQTVKPKKTFWQKVKSCFSISKYIIL
jgi:hypothetical protein